MCSATGPRNESLAPTRYSPQQTRNAPFHIYSKPQAGSDAVPGRAGGYPTGPPTVPDVSNSLIRFVSIRTASAVRITSRLTRPAGAELGYPSPVTRMLFRRLVGSKSFPSLLPVPRSARLRLPSRGSLGSPFPTFTGTMLSYDCPVSLSGRFASRSLPDTLSAPSFVSRTAVRW